MTYVGDFAEDSIVRIPLTTHLKTGGASAPSSAFEAADFKIFKNSSATEKTTTNGITITSPFDALTGLHFLEINTGTDTGDAGFWTTGSDYFVVLSPDETVDGETVIGVVGIFSIQNRYTAPTWTSAEKEQVRHRLGIDGTATAPSVATGCDLGDLTLSKLVVFNSAGDTPVEITGNNANYLFTISDLVWGGWMSFSPELGLLSLLTGAAEPGGDPVLGEIYANLSGKVLGDGTGSILGTGINAHVATMAANSVTASAMAADAVTEIQSGLATAANLSTVAGYLDTEIVAIINAIADMPTNAEFEARTLAAADYFVVTDYTAPPSAAAIATATRTELATELGRIDATVSTRASQTTADAIVADTNEVQTDWAQIRHRLGIDGTATAPSTATGAKLGDVLVSQILINTNGVVDKSGFEIQAIGAGAEGILVRAPNPFYFVGIGAANGVMYFEPGQGTLGLLNAAQAAGRILGNLSGDVTGKVIGGGTGTITGTGVAVDATAAQAAASAAITAYGVATSAQVAAAATSVITHGDGDGEWGAAGAGGGGAGTNGTGDVQIVATTTPVASNVKVSIVGTGTYDHTGTLGVATLNVDPDESYTLRITPPAGYEAVDDIAIAIGTEDQAVPITLVPITYPTAPTEGICEINDYVLDASLDGVEGATVTAVAANDAALVDAGIMSKVVARAVTDSAGYFQLRLVRADAMTAGTDYTITIKHQGKSIYRTIVGQVPNEATALLKDIVQA